MRSLIIAAFVTMPCIAGADTPRDPPSPTIPYRHLWTDAHGKSHLALCEFKTFDLKTMSAPAAPQWQNRLGTETMTTIATVQPDQWLGDWHEDPKPQWIIPLAGRWFIEAMDGTRFEMGPGEIAFGEDLNTVPDESGPMKGKKGHLSGNVGGGEVKLFVIQLGEKVTINQPCRFK